MPCRSTPAGSAFSTIARYESGLSDVQIISLWSAIRREDADLVECTPEQWNRTLDGQIARLNANTSLTEARRRSIVARLEAARQDVPDASSYRAMTLIEQRAVAQQTAVTNEMSEIATMAGWSDEETESRWHTLNDSVDRSRNAALPGGYTDDSVAAAKRRGLPLDRSSIHAFTMLRQQAEQAHTSRADAAPRRITRRAFPGSSAVAEAGYDPRGGRLEVVMGSGDRVYAYRNVPTDVWDRMQGESAGRVFAQTIRGNPNYQYRNQAEADAAAAAPRCTGCGQFAAVGHNCPTFPTEGTITTVPASIPAEPEVTPAAAATPVAVAETAPEPATTASEAEERATSAFEEIFGETPEEVLAATIAAEAAPEPDATPEEATANEPAEEPAEPGAPAPARRRRQATGPAPFTGSEDAYEDRLTTAVRTRDAYGYSMPSISEHYDLNEDESIVRATTFDPGEVRRAATTGVATMRLVNISNQRSGNDAYRTTRAITTAQASVALIGDRWEGHVRGQCDCQEYARENECRHIRGMTAQVLGQVLPADTESGRPKVTAMATARTMSSSTCARVPNLARYDNVSLPNLTNLRREARSFDVEFQSSWQGSRYHGHDAVLGYGSFGVTANTRVRRDGNEYSIEHRDLKCSCSEYQRTYDCPHVREYAAIMQGSIVPAAGSGSSALPVDPEAVQRQLEAEQAQDWTRREDLMAEAQASWATTSDEENYSTNFEEFEKDVAAATQRVANGQSALEYQTENVMNGLCAPGSNEGFGIELEFDLKGLDQYQKRTAIDAIAREMYSEGLGTHNTIQGYHSGAATVHRQHQRGWRFERDCTVDGEIISPVMQDTPETWANVQKVCDIITRHGGKATAKTGSHVHVSAPSMTGRQAANLIHTVNQHEDVLYRLSQNPEVGKHRPTQWCAPNSQIHESTVDLDGARRHGYGHNVGMNLQHVRGAESDHPEFRHWDGTLDPAIIQAQAKMSVAMVGAARRNADKSNRRTKEERGSHKRRQALLRGRSRRALTSEELKDDSATTRSFIDTLFSRPEDKKQIASLFAITKWS